ncbi:MAG: hypothetical protein IKE15_04190 [Clostridia bacterium]|nr:hypothetical protein [Clostridia bacterium]
MDITSAVLDPELGCTAFTVERITYTRTRAGTASRTVTVQAQGCVHPGTPEMIRLLPEEEREEQFIAIYTDYALSTGVPEGPASSIVAAPHSGDGSFQMTSPSAILPPLAVAEGSPRSSGASFTGADRIRWNNQTWRVVRVRDWGAFGYYQAYAVLMRES